MKSTSLILLVSSLFFCCLFGSKVFATGAEGAPSTLFFEHWRHYDSQGIACNECHKESPPGIFSFPDHLICESCHPKGKLNDYENAGTDGNCAKCHPKNTTYSTTFLSRVDRAKRTFFHSAKTQPLCTTCHGLMLEDRVSLGTLLLSQEERNKVRRKSHRFHFVDDCKSCHIDGRNTSTPPSNHTSNWLESDHKTVAPQFQCRICHTKSFCQNCHENTY